jgi:hypothetical protein
MISYSWHDDAAAELLHDEVALRGFQVIHDRYSFTEGSRIPANMTDAVRKCDVFVAYLTPHSLYLDDAPDTSRPALHGELMPALRRRRDNLTPGRVDSPIILPLAHGLGDREEATEILQSATGEDFASLWRGEWLDQTTPHITQSEAARVADQALRALLTREPPENPLTLHVATRGSTPPAHIFTVDATRLLGLERRPGTPPDWIRFWQALRSVCGLLEPYAGDGAVHIRPACHLTAAFAVGRTFHQASRWTPTISTRHGDATPAPTSLDVGGLMGGFDQYAESGDLLIDIDLLGHDVAAMSDQTAQSLRLGGRISLRRTSRDDLTPDNIAQIARYVADQARTAHATLRPPRIHLTMSTPAAFSVLLGYHTTALQSDIITYETDGSRYTEALTVPRDAA